MSSYADRLKGLPGFWAGKRVFLTGHTGFKGSWLAFWLSRLGAEVKGYALPPNESQSLYGRAGIDRLLVDSDMADIRDAEALRHSLQEFEPDIVFHLAAQALVRESYRTPLETIATNVIGTANLLDALRQLDSVRACVVVTTDKCYENQEWHWGYREIDALGGHDPYSTSKACAELITQCWRRSFFEPEGTSGNHPHCAIATARAGNVIGGGDGAKDRLIPDVMASLSTGREILLRNPASQRPWQHVLEPLSGYLLLAEGLFVEGSRQLHASFGDRRSWATAWNFGPEEASMQSVRYVVEYLIGSWGRGHWRQLDGRRPHEATLLKLDCSEARARIGWQPVWSLEQALEAVIRWYREPLRLASTEAVRALMQADMNHYLHSAIAFDPAIGYEVAADRIAL